MTKTIGLILSILLSLTLFSKETRSISKTEKEFILTKVKSLITEHYVFPNKSDIINLQLTSSFNNGHYDTISNFQVFIAELQKDLRSISKDAHFALNLTSGNNISRKQRARNWNNFQRFNNYGFSKLEILDGNVGYIKIDFFAKPDKRILKPVFRFVENTNAIIIDLRDNNGGMREMVALLSSFFITGKVELAIIEANNKKIEKITTSRFLKKGRMTEVPIVILTSPNSFSAAEFLAYSLQQLNRATIIGSPTGGGAHSIERFNVSDSLLLAVPIENVINPITNSNWEGTGVIPDRQSDYKSAVINGHLFLLEELKMKTALESEKSYYDREIKKIIKESSLESLKNNINPSGN